MAGGAGCPAGGPLGEESLKLCPAKKTAAAEAEAELIGKESVIVRETIGTQPVAEAGPAFETSPTGPQPASETRQSDCPNVQSWFWDGGNEGVYLST